MRLIQAGDFTAYPDALRFVIATKDAGMLIADASSSKNAALFLRQIQLDTFAPEHGISSPALRPGLTLLDYFDADVSGLPLGPPGRWPARRTGHDLQNALPGGPGNVGGDDVCGVPVQGGSGPVVAHGGARVGVRGGFLHVAQRDAGIQRRGDKCVPERTDLPILYDDRPGTR